MKDSAIADEIILVKGAGKLHLERLVMTFFAPVRCWKDICGRRTHCIAIMGRGCSLYATPFDQHKAADSPWSIRCHLTDISAEALSTSAAHEKLDSMPDAHAEPHLVLEEIAAFIGREEVRVFVTAVNRKILNK